MKKLIATLYISGSLISLDLYPLNWCLWLRIVISFVLFVAVVFYIVEEKTTENGN